MERLCAALGIDVDQVEPVESTTQRVGIAFLFAIETAMRAGEICKQVVRARQRNINPAALF